MKSFFLFIAFIILSISAFSQDIIIRTNDDIINCKITKVDSATVYFDILRDGKVINSFIGKELVKVVKYNVNSGIRGGKYSDNKQHRSAITFGFLQGGGALFGCDYELFLPDYVGLQIGGGLFAFGGGINIHFKPDLRSSFLSIQYWHQGFGDNFTQSLIGPSIVFRGKKWFTFQIGVGMLQESGPARPTGLSGTSTMLTYSIGIYTLD